jgi:two-component system nitrate/nitrite response regulator NarL
MSNNIQIILVDDHPVVRDGLQHMLAQEKDMQVIWKGAGREEVLSQVEKLSPNVVVMDIKMPDVDGIELTRQLKQKNPSCNVIMLTLYDQYLIQAIEAGAKGYLLKDIQRDELTQAIRQVNQGRIVVSESIKSMTPFEYAERSDATLTRPREAQSKPVETSVKPVEEKREAKLPEASRSAIEEKHEIKIKEAIKTVEYKDNGKTERTPNPIDETLIEEVQLVLPPPIEANQLMRFVTRAEEAFHYRVLQVIGSWQEGTIITITLPHAISSTDVLGRFKNMSEIETVADKLLNGEVNSKLLRSAEAVPRTKERARQTVFVTLEKGKN